MRVVEIVFVIFHARPNESFVLNQEISAEMESLEIQAHRFPKGAESCLRLIQSIYLQLHIR